MRKEKRRAHIMEMLQHSNTVLIQDIVDATGVSEATIRRDIIYLESVGALKRFWGGVQRLETPDNLRKAGLISYKSRHDFDAIGRLAASRLKDNQLIFIGSGMTTLSMIPYIKNRSISVITNGIPQLEALYEKRIQALLLCGFFKEYSRSLVGKEALEMLAKYKFDHAFLGVHGIDDKLNLLSADNYEESIKKICIRQSRQTYLLADKSKFSRTAYYALPAEEARDTILITDQKPFEHPEWIEKDGGYIGKIENLLR
ncbi:MAG: DeoR/GlpR family DNA-binding transcription regulator [Saccharofermentanales bacterium]